MNGKVPPKTYEVLKNVVSGNIEDYVISVHDANKKGEGYLGQIFFISLQNKDTDNQLNLVVKQAFADQTIRDMHPIKDAFDNEINFYKLVWPKLLKFQEVIPPMNRFFHLPKCFATTSEENYESLVLENLKFDGFKLHDKKKPLVKDQFELIFKVYGRFHAISFANKALNPEGFSEVTSNVTDVWDIFCSAKNFIEFTEILLEQVLALLQSDLDNAIIEKYMKYVTGGIKVFRKLLITGKNTVITHGDCWSNNMMFKYNDDGKLVDLRFLDFQLARLGSPVCDLSYCLYSGGTKETFDQLDHFLQVYHDSLSQNLRAFGCDPDELYPWEELKNDWKLYCEMGLTLSLMIWRGKMTNEDSAVDMIDLSNDAEGMKAFFKTGYDQETFKRRAKDILVHLHENNYLS